MKKISVFMWGGGIISIFVCAALMCVAVLGISITEGKWGEKMTTNHSDEPPIEVFLYGAVRTYGDSEKNDTYASILTEKNYDFYLFQKIFNDEQNENNNNLTLFMKALPDHGVLYGDHDKNVNRTESAPHRHFQEGVALFYRKDRWELDGEEHGNIWYETKPKEVAPQVVVWGLFHEKTIEGYRTGKSVYVYATHFWPNSGGKRAVPSPLADRETKIVDLMTKIASRKYSDVPVIIGADFNSGEDSPLIRFLKGEEVEIAGQPQKCPVPLVDSLRTVYPFAERKAVASASNSIGRIRLTNNLTSKGRCDYIFVSSSLNPADFRLIKTKTQSGVFPSYHYPQHATLSW